MRYRSSILFIFFVCLGVLTHQAGSQTLGGSPGAPFRMGFGAKGIAMGNAVVAANDGDIVGYQNPALLPFQLAPTAAVSVGVLSLDRSLNFFSYSQALKPTAGISFGLINAGVGNIEGRDRDGERTETYSTSENAFLFSFALRTSDAFSLGLTAKLFYYALFTDVSSTTVGFDVGAAYSISSDFHLGLTVHDIASKYRWETTRLYGREGNSTTEYFPVRIRFGAHYTLDSWKTQLGIESELVQGTVLYRVGFVQPLIDALVFRLGVDQISPAGHVASKPSFGFSFSSSLMQWKPTVHYAFVLEPYAPSAMHVISVALSFP